MAPGRPWFMPGGAPSPAAAVQGRVRQIRSMLQTLARSRPAKCADHQPCLLPNPPAGCEGLVAALEAAEQEWAHRQVGAMLRSAVQKPRSIDAAGQLAKAVGALALRFRRLSWSHALHALNVQSANPSGPGAEAPGGRCCHRLEPGCCAAGGGGGGGEWGILVTSHSPACGLKQCRPGCLSSAGRPMPCSQQQGSPTAFRRHA